MNGIGIHQISVHTPQSRVWEFVSDLNAWAHLVPGYIEHTILSVSHSVWKFNAHYGVVKKKVHVQVEITEWMEPVQVKFKLKGVNQTLTGEGYFKAEKISNTTTDMTGYLKIQSTSVLAGFLESLFDKMIHNLTKELTEAVADAIQRNNK
ncbi:SRPBCC family protein [Rossellomorea sp. AcN35-11]|nr:SRPBCC family protein [Rossellomorea aquimaris]WJV28520.1 SRPBCC family protein [Rossellomorea sp. AcN35-11]